jgi:hypothetical protein
MVHLVTLNNVDRLYITLGFKIQVRLTLTMLNVSYMFNFFILAFMVIFLTGSLLQGNQWIHLWVLLLITLWNNFK